jgi:hypothetical protein
MGSRTRKARRKQRRATGTAIADNNPWRDAMTVACEDTIAWMADEPENAALLADVTEAEVGHWIVGIANADKLGFPAGEQQASARAIRRWAIVNGIVWMHDWPTPVSVMTEQEIIDAIREEQQAGLLLPLLPG